jgi:hypothetical protein
VGGTDVLVGVNVAVGISVGVSGVSVGVAVGGTDVLVAVGVAVSVAVSVGVGVSVGSVGVLVVVGVAVTCGVVVPVGVGVGEAGAPEAMIVSSPHVLVAGSLAPSPLYTACHSYLPDAVSVNSAESNGTPPTTGWRSVKTGVPVHDALS